MKKNKIYIVPHTHWDKEWYFIKDVSDVYLVDNMKNIIEKNKAQDEALFCYDGQYSIIDDYLKFYPEQKDILKKLVTEKKLIIGPWYTQPDTFNTLGESIVRNLLVGTKLSQELGNSMKVAYLPDSFGSNANFGQIVAKSNNLGAINWRGAEDDMINNSLFNLWENEDGSTVPLYNLFRHGYFTGVGGLLNQYHKNWSKGRKVNWDPENNAEGHAQFYIDFLQKELEILQPLGDSTNNRFLIPVGSDQMPMVKGWKQVVNAMNKLDSKSEYILSDFEMFMSDLVSDEEVMKKVKTVKGQFRYGKYARAHKTISSSRYDIKYLSRKVENLLYRELEPLALIFKKMNGEYPSQIILEATKMLVSCHAHDSLGGCNTDETNRAIIARLESAWGLIEGQITLIKKRISDAIGLDANEILLFNLEPHKVNKKFNLLLNTKKSTFELNDKDKKIEFNYINQLYFDNDNFRIIDSSLEYDIESKKELDNWKDADMNATNILLDTTSGRFQTEVQFKIEMPSFGYKIIKLNELENEKILKPSSKNFIENDLYKLFIENNELNLFDKKNNVNYTNVFSFEAHIDAGDTYDYSPPQDLQNSIHKLDSLDAFTQESNKARVLNLNYNFSFITNKKYDYYKNLNQSFNVQIIMIKNVFDIRINTTNNVKNIRWRALFKTKIINSKLSFADQSFAISKREVHDKFMDLFEQQNWVDSPIEIESCESLIYLKNENNAFSIFTNGTNEYQIIGEKDETIAVTLFRGVSYIGNRDLLYRKGRASGINDYPHPTPESNLLKEMNFRLGMFISEKTDKLNKLSKDFVTENCYYQRQSINQFQWKGDTFVLSQRDLPKIKDKENSFLEIKNTENLVITAFKESWDKKNAVIRLYNPTENIVLVDNANILRELNIIEEPISNSKNYSLKSNEFKTFEIKL